MSKQTLAERLANNCFTTQSRDKSSRPSLAHGHRRQYVRVRVIITLGDAQRPTDRPTDIATTPQSSATIDSQNFAMLAGNYRATMQFRDAATTSGDSSVSTHGGWRQSVQKFDIVVKTKGYGNKNCIPKPCNRPTSYLPIWSWSS